MRRKKKFDFAKGKYYFTVDGKPTEITISRLGRQDAVDAYLRYLNVGKAVSWQGQWNGKKFIDDNIEELLAA